MQERWRIRENGQDTGVPAPAATNDIRLSLWKGNRFRRFNAFANGSGCGPTSQKQQDPGPAAEAVPVQTFELLAFHGVIVGCRWNEQRPWTRAAAEVADLLVRGDGGAARETTAAASDDARVSMQHDGRV